MLSGVIHSPCSFQKLITACMTFFLRNKTKNQSLFLSRESRRPHRVASPRKTRVETFGSSGEERTTTTLCPLSFPPTINFRSQEGSVGRWQPVAWMLLLVLPWEKREKKNASHTPPMSSYCRVSAARRGKLRTVRGCGEGGCCVGLSEFKPEFTRRMWL